MIEVITGWFEWSNLYLQLPLGIIGFLIAIWQIVGAKRAAVAAKEAADSAIANFKSRSIASLIPQLTQLEEMITKAANARSSEFLGYALHTWGWQAGMCRELLNEDFAEDKKTMQKIQRSNSAANRLRRDLLTVTDGTDFDAMTLRFRGAVLDVTSQLQTLSAALVVRSPSE